MAKELKPTVSEFISENITDNKLNGDTFYVKNELLRFILLRELRITT